MIKTAPTSLKIRQVITDIQSGSLIPRPEFQRRLVWSTADKNHFIDTIIRGYPFPEIYIADGEVDLETGKGTQLLVDGQQRMTTILEYFTGSPAMKLTKDLIAYHELSDAQKKDFLNYDVAVRNLGFVTREQIIDIFRRINSTNYSLNDMEINNAMYAGKFKLFCEGLAELEFFEKKSFFRPMQLRRMGDVKYIATIIITMIGGYFNRDDLLEEYLRRYNDEFPEEDDLRNRFSRNLSCIEQLGLDEKSRAWKQSDFFTLICEIDNLQHVKNQKIDVRKSKVKLTKFYEAMNFPHELMQPEFAKLHEEVQAYTSATIQAANDRTNRVLRGRLIRERIVSR